MNLEQLKSQLASLEQELEGAKASFYRAEGAIAIVKHSIAQLEAPVDKDAKSPEAKPKKG